MPPSEADFRRPSNAAALVRAIRSLTDGARPLRIMEICGTHTMAIAQAGLRGLLAPGVQLLSGPGCPVCVTPAGAIDAVLALSERPGVIIASYDAGDNTRGIIGVVGPTRMDYSAVAEKLSLLAAGLSQRLGGGEGPPEGIHNKLIIKGDISNEQR